MEMYQDGVRVWNLPNESSCVSDEKRRSPLEIEECPIGEEFCTGNCMYYTEN